MKTIAVSLPQQLEIEVDNYVKKGWFFDEQEVMRAALQEFIRHNRLSLTEKFMKEDIEWALETKEMSK